MAGRAEEIGWLRFVSRAPYGFDLDPNAYPRLKHITGQPPKTEWTCVQPNLIVHDDARIARTDVRVLPPPRMGRMQIGWLQRGIKILRRDWAEGIADLVDGERVAFGDILVGGEVLPDWVTLHSVLDPPLLSENCSVAICAICGGRSTMSWGNRHFFGEPRAAELPLIVNSAGIFVREDEFEMLGLKAPFGSYRTERVTCRPDLGLKLWPPLASIKPGKWKHLHLMEDGPPEGLALALWPVRRFFNPSAKP